MALSFIIWVISSFLGLAAIIYVIMIFNGLISLKNNISKSWANIDVLLKQRSEELPNVVNTVKGYMKHEKTLFITLAKARSDLIRATSITQKARADDTITETLKSLFAISEDYPKLRANENFLKLQQRISALENEIADRREFYNDSVTAYNIRIQTFPDLIVARLLGYKEPASLFQATGEEKQAISLSFQE